LNHHSDLITFSLLQRLGESEVFPILCEPALEFTKGVVSCRSPVACWPARLSIFPAPLELFSLYALLRPATFKVTSPPWFFHLVTTPRLGLQGAAGPSEGLVLSFSPFPLLVNALQPGPRGNECTVLLALTVRRRLF